MSHQEPLSRHAIAISISESADMAVLGLSEEHLTDAMAEIARYLLGMGARLLYGGDLRADGFTEVLFELVARHRRETDSSEERVGVTNFLPWPSHVSLKPEEVERWSEAFDGVAELVFLTLDGEIMPPDERRRMAERPAADEEWARGLTAMREMMSKVSDARIVLGGKVEGFKGRMPGVAEEALIALRAGQPLFLLGGFGGCARAITEELRLSPPWPVPRAPWPGRIDFANFTAESLNNGLDKEENATLATTVHVDQAVTLILRGLLRKIGDSDPVEAEG